MPERTVDPMFNNEKLFDVEENQLHFKQILGLGEQKPFECIGERGEVQLAFEMCRQKGLSGKAMEAFENKFGPALDVSPNLNHYTTVHKIKHGIPEHIAGPIIDIMEIAAMSIISELHC